MQCILAAISMAQLQDDGATEVVAEEEAVPQNGHSTYAVFSVLSNILDKDEVSLQEFEEKDRPKVLVLLAVLCELTCSVG